MKGGLSCQEETEPVLPDRAQEQAGVWAREPQGAEEAGWAAIDPEQVQGEAVYAPIAVRRCRTNRASHAIR